MRLFSSLERSFFHLQWVQTMSRFTTSVSALVVAGILLVCGIFWLKDARGLGGEGRRGKITIGKETTFATEPIDAKGYVDYVVALNERMKKGVTPDNNANVLIWKALGPHPEGATLCPEFFEAMGITAPPEKGDYFRELYKYLKEELKIAPETDMAGDFYEKLNDTINTVTQRPWTAKDHPNIEKWLKSNDKPLAVVAEAAKREQFYNPLIPQSLGKPTPGLIGALLPAVQKCRELGTALAARAMLRAGEGDRAGAGKICRPAIDSADSSLAAVA